MTRSSGGRDWRRNILRYRPGKTRLRATIAPFAASVVASIATSTTTAAAAPVTSAVAVLRGSAAGSVRCGPGRRLTLSLFFGFGKILTGTVCQTLRLGRIICCGQLRLAPCGFRPLRLPHIPDTAIRRHHVGQILVVLFQLHKVGNVEEGIALQADVNEGRLHSRKNAGDAALIDG